MTTTFSVENHDAIVIGGGPAGLAAALALKKNGIDDILILEREDRPGGILRQCIHDGFGLERFGESLSGPEYAGRFVDMVGGEGIPCLTGVTVTGLTPDRVVTAQSPGGLNQYRGKAVILAMGCRERTQGQISIPGDRPAGVYTAGVAQAYVNLFNTMVGREVVILGSGDIGLIMARRLTLEGCTVKAVFELLPYHSGLPRNVRQCLDDYGIPLFTSHTVTRVNANGGGRLESITVAQVDAAMQPVPGTGKDWKCDTLVLSVGLIPENELSRQAGVELDPATSGPMVDDFFETSVPGIFAAGNVLHVHDLVDFVSLEAEAMAAAAARRIRGGDASPATVEIVTGDGIGHVVPRRTSPGKAVPLSFRVSSPLRDGSVVVRQGTRVLKTLKRPRLIPAEMLELSLPEGAVESGMPLEVTVQ